MKQLFQKTAILALAVLLIMATGGFSIYHHFCHCAGESSASIFMETTCGQEDATVQEPVSCCMHEQAAVQEPESCCNADQTESCCKDQPEVKQEKSCKKEDCCNTSSTYLKISDNFTVSLGKISLKFIVSFIQILTGLDLQPESRTADFLNPEFNDTSPPVYGTDLLHHIHQLKIAHPLV